MNAASLTGENFILRVLKRISGWAAHNVMWARLAIIACYILLFVLNIYFGRLLQSEGIIASKTVVYTVFILTVILYAFYKVAQSRWEHKHRFVFHKVCYMAVLLVSFAGVATVFSRPVGTLQQDRVLADMPVSTMRGNATDKPATHDSQPEKKLPLGAKIALIALVAVLSVTLEFMLAALACTIACAGGAVAALALLIVGTAGIVFLAVIMIMKILGRARRRHRHS